MDERLDIDTFNAKVDIVICPDNIRFYSQERDDYTELALTAIRQKSDVIYYISPSCKDYSTLCEEAVNDNIRTFLLIKDSANNYKQLGIKAITKNPFLVLDLPKEKKDYCFFWELSVSMRRSLLQSINEEQKELFPLLEKVVQQNPYELFRLNRRIPIYGKLCNIAYSKNKELIKYMNINYVDKYLIMEIIKNNPERIKYLDNSNDYYVEAWKLALSLNGQLIKDMNYPFTVDDVDSLFELINIAQDNAPEVTDYSITLYALKLENRKRKEKLLSTPNILGDNIYKLMKEIDDEYESLSKAYTETLITEKQETSFRHSNCISDGPVKTKTKNN